jgi:integrase
MAKRRRGRGEGSIEELSSGHWRAVTPSRMVDGKRVRASRVFQSKPEAIAWLTAEIASGRQPAAGTVGEWLTEWLAKQQRDTGTANYQTDKGLVDRHLLPTLGSVKLRDLDRRKCSDFLSRLPGTKSTRHAVGRTLRKALNAAVDAGRIAVTPMARMRIAARPDAEAKPFTVAELGKFVEAAEASGYGVLARVWADAGLRPSELIGLQWGDYDAARGTLTVQRAIDRHTGLVKPPKTKRSRRTIPLAASTRAAIEGIRPDPDATADFRTQPMFGAGSYHGRTITHRRYRNFVRDVWKKIHARLPAGQRWATPYTLRHTCASLLLQAGVSLRTVSERLGHSDVALTLRVYAHVLPGDQDRAAAVMDTILPG